MEFLTEYKREVLIASLYAFKFYLRIKSLYILNIFLFSKSF